MSSPREATLEVRDEAPLCPVCYLRTGNLDAEGMLWDPKAEDWVCPTHDRKEAP